MILFFFKITSIKQKIPSFNQNISYMYFVHAYEYIRGEILFITLYNYKKTLLMAQNES